MCGWGYQPLYPQFYALKLKHTNQFSSSAWGDTTFLVLAVCSCCRPVEC